jgi:para-aminobenzoate synthetase / 4-amino-4-deoxychorismate lyase
MDHPNNPLVVLRDTLNGEWLHFENPERVFSISQPDEIVPALKEVEALVNQHGWYAAGFVSYEAAAAFDSAFATHAAAGLPLLWFGLYPTPRKTKTLPPKDGSFHLGNWTPSITQKPYNTAIARIKQHIANGETYQVNYTFRLRSRFRGNPWPLFVDLLNAQHGGYPAFIDTGPHVICSTSPELFFRLDGNQVTCHPMKGTTRRGRTLAEDELQAEWLRTSEKNRAENIMIVDMLRNDLGRVAETGTVHVPKLFTVERYRTLWQMTSTVRAEVSAPFVELFAALFPSASITGAPKISTMKIIAALETTPRGAYSGAIGFLAPGRRAQFNVAIRTVVIDRETGQAQYGVGGGVVWDSTAQDEYGEALLKAHILTEQQPEFSLLETLRWTPHDGYFLLEKHLQRLRDSALYFGFPFEAHNAETKLAELGKTFAGPQRVRLLLGPDGTLTLQAVALSPATFGSPESPGESPLRVKLAAAPVYSDDVFLFHKTTRREAYEKARASQPGCDDVLLYNERGELTESTIANLVLELDGKLLTPPVACSLLAGTFREALLEQGLIQEHVIPREELAHCTNIFLVNSVRGWMKAELA